MDKPNKNNENCQERPMNTNFEEIFYQSPIGIIFYDEEGRLTNANDSALNIAKIPKLEDVLGTNIFDNPKIASKKEDLQKKGLIKFQDSLDLIQIKEQNIYNPVEPKIIDIDWTVSVTDSGYLIQIQDITDRKKAEEEIIRERNILNVIIESTEGPIFSIDSNYRYTSFNSQHAKVMKTLFDVDIEIGGNLLDYHTNPEDRKNAKINVDKVFNGETVVVDSFAGNSPQNRRYFSIFHNPIKDSNCKITGAAIYAQDYTERKEAEEALKVSEERLDLAQKVSNVGTFDLDFQTGVNLWTSELEAMYGLQTGEFDGTLEAWEKLIHPEDRTKTVHQSDISIETGKPTEYEWRVIWPDDSIHWLFGRWKVFKDDNGKPLKMIGVNIDITELKKAEEALVVSEKRYRELFNSMTEMFQVIELIYDTKGKPIDYFYSDVNPAFCGLVGKTRGDLIDKRVKKIFGIVEDYWLEKYDEVAKTGNPIQFENYGAELDKWYEVNVWKVGENQVAIIFTDTTERKHREEREKKFIDELKRSNQELERFAYVSSHDLQEPLRMVTLYSQLLERRYKDSLDSDADDFIEYIVENARRMKQLIDDLLDYSRVASQAKEFENVELEKVLNIVLTNLSASIAENNVEVTHESLPTVFVDNNQMMQVFQNLITNAIKFRGVEPPEINISAQKGQTEWTFSISDNGIGIKPEHQKQIFDVFKRLHTREEYPGTGIGLSICQKIIKHHGGRIWVESEPGKGSTFYFTIPIYKNKAGKTTRN